MTKKEDLRETMLEAMCDLLDVLSNRPDVTEACLSLTKEDEDRTGLHRYQIMARIPQREITLKQPTPKTSDYDEPDPQYRGSQFQPVVGKFDPDHDAIGG